VGPQEALAIDDQQAGFLGVGQQFGRVLSQEGYQRDVYSAQRNPVFQILTRFTRQRVTEHRALPVR